MPFRVPPHFFGAVLFAFALPAAAADGDVLSELSPTEKPACFGRVYDAQHLKDHPRQKTQRIFLLHGHDPLGRANEESRAHPSPWTVFLATTMRGDATPRGARAWCYARTSGPDKGYVYCETECNGHMGFLKLEPSGTLSFTDLPRDFYVDRCSDQALDPAAFARRSFDADDDNFKLAPQPIEACMAEFAQVAPPDSTLGPPLRERLRRDQPVCYGRDYDAAHLRLHPDQVTTSIRLAQGPTQIERYAQFVNPDARWPGDAEFDVSTTTRKDGKVQTERIMCGGEGDQWYCFPSHGACILSAYRPMFLRRGHDGAILLANPQSGLPIVDLCAPEGKGATRSDDKIFRLEPMPLSACGL